MRRIAQELSIDGFAQRGARVNTRRGANLTDGPDHVWSMDAYCKLDNWGIEIYAAIDVYSRRVIWAYVGVSSKTQASVLAQYLETALAGGRIPKIIRTDRGVETALVADAHYYLRHTMHRNGDRSGDRGGDRSASSSIELGDCFHYGTSKQNQRIESWWGQLAKSAISRWRDWFRELSNVGDYSCERIGDRIAFLAVYVPIIRQEVCEFIHLWNHHRIRRQKNRPYLVHGIPEILYNTPEAPATNQAIEVPNDLVARLKIYTAAIGMHSLCYLGSINASQISMSICLLSRKRSANSS